MEFKQVVAERTSVRQFSEQPVAEDQIREIVRIAGLAPSVNNSQPWKFVAVTDSSLLKQMADAVHGRLEEILKEDEPGKPGVKTKVDFFSTFFVAAPCVIAVLREPYVAVVDQILDETRLSHEQINQLRGQPDVLSLGAAIQNLLLACTDQGLASCWLSGPLVARDQLEKLLDVQEPWSLAAMVAVGQARGASTPRERKAVDEILSFVR